MHAKHMRILIADADQPLRLSVEKQLNQVGRYGVALVATFEELSRLLAYPGRSLDLILVNYNLLDQQPPTALKALHKQRNVVMYRNGLFSGRLADPLAQVNEGLWCLPKPAGTGQKTAL